MSRPGHRIGACFGKAALKTHALQTLRDCRASPNRAKRLECVRFIGAVRPRGLASGSWSLCAIEPFHGGEVTRRSASLQRGE